MAQCLQKMSQNHSGAHQHLLGSLLQSLLRLSTQKRDLDEDNNDKGTDQPSRMLISAFYRLPMQHCLYPST